MSGTSNPSTQAPLKPIRRERDPGRTARTVKVQEPELPAQETVGTGKDGKEKVAKVLQLSSFERNFNVENFIGDLSEKLITSSKANTGALDPLPFISSFSPALDHLLSLQKSVSRKTKELEGEVREAERSCEGRLREIDGGFETIGSSFTALETKITGVGRTAVRIGEQMESLHNLRSVAQSASLILSYYLSLSQPPAPALNHLNAEGNPSPAEPSQTPLDALFATRTSREGRARLAIILRRLSTLAKDVVENASAAASNAQDNARDSDDDKGRLVKLRADVDKAIRIRDEVEKYAERFEKECLRLFDRSYRKGDVRMMAHCAKILQDFNNCTSCIQMYVNQHDFFISKDKVLEEASGLNPDGTPRADAAPIEDIWTALNDSNKPAPTAEPGLTALSKEIRSTVDQEAQIIQAVFPMKEDVMRVFLQRVFAQVIQQHLETLFARAAVQGTLALLRMLRLTHSQCSVLIEDLKQYDFSGFGGEANTTVSVTTDRRTGVSTTVTLASMLDTAMEEMFSQYIEGGRYLELEGKWMAIAYKDLAHKYQRFHETQIKSKPGNLLDRVVDKLSTNTGSSGVVPAAPSATSSATSAAAAWLHRYGGNALTGVTGSKDITRSTTPAQSGASSPVTARNAAGQQPHQNGTEGLNQADGVVKLEIIEKFLRIHAEAVGRVVELSVGGETAQNASKLAKLLADDIGGDYLELALESASSKLDGQDRSEPDLSILGQIRQVDLALHLWQTYYSTVLVPLVSSSPAVRRDALRWNANTVTRVEGKVNTLVLRFLDASVSWLSVLLKRQKNSDFKPKDEEMSFARTTTEPCTLCCSYLERLNEAGHKAFAGKNAEAFFTELGVEFHGLLLDHYKRFPVNPTGGLMLTKDLAAYQDSIKTFGIPLLNDRFDMLRQLGNSFIVQPDVLKSYLTEGHLGRIDARLLRPYLQQRSDWSTFAKQFGEEEAFADKSDQDVVTATTSGLLKASRYSMGVGAAGMSKLKDMLKAVDDHAFGDTIPSQHYRSSNLNPGLNRAPSYRGNYPATQGFFVP
ncbi:exocyst complex component Sec10-domain-containing protein [Filobasidium floriforme]|uniref:exocyst complex component Sec10-domain-containing protein n=1 Tax=Filobasidium floriforme TaxID=5210 RepID=UPI001E8CF323|nr:exocyst complex component Sec10-domain-containing protein [Filobasidium floriforme]KAH8084591.1 exocyst complex component Sec10-domain-containing protein [Filobasidium floriforme]